MRAALAGTDTLFLVSGHEGGARVALHKAAVDAAVATRVRRLVYLSFLGAAPDATFTFAHDHFATEQHVRGTRLAHTFLRSSLYLDLVPEWVSPDGVIAGPAGDGRVAWISRDDLADVAVEVLTGTGHDGATYDVTGAPALTLAETAEVLAGFAGRPVRYHAETLDEARASRSRYGAPAWEVEGWVTSYAAIATGEMGVVADTVQKLTGHPPQTLPEYLRTHPDSYAHLRR
jgi:NAD(P)H dehydrogenase (quinone)